MQYVKVTDGNLVNLFLEWTVQFGAATCSEGFVKCFLRVPQAVWLRKQKELSENI